MIPIKKPFKLYALDVMIKQMLRFWDFENLKRPHVYF